jgi:ribosomal protein L4
MAISGVGVEDVVRAAALVISETALAQLTARVGAPQREDVGAS